MYDKNIFILDFEKIKDLSWESLENKKENEEEWECPYCSNINKASELNCHGCGAPKTKKRRAKDVTSDMIESLFC